MNTIYELLNRMITTGNYTKGDMENKLDVFFAVNRITQDQYLELVNKINPPAEKVETPKEPTETVNKPEGTTPQA
ncbi:hypothetical protein UT300003_07860 [Clostridium sardiniense]